MSKPAALFVAAAMAVTAGCVAVIASYGLDLDAGASTLAGAAALAGMAVTHLAFLRAAPKDDSRLDDIDRLVTDLQSRLETLELRISTLDAAVSERARAASKPLVEEIAALGGLLTTIAKEVATHDVAIAKLNARDEESWPALPAPLEPPAHPAPAPDPVPERPSVQSAAPATRPPVAVPTPASAPPPAPPTAAPQTDSPPPAAALAAPEKLQRPEPLDLDGPELASGPGLDGLAAIAQALREDRLETHLQPIVALPSRRTAHYEAYSRIVEDDGLLEASAFVEVARASKQIAEIDRRTVQRCAAVALRLSARGGGAVFVNVAPQTLADARALAAITSLLDGQEELRRLLVLEFRQPDFAGLSPDARKTLDGFVEQGVRLSLDGAPDLRFEPRELSRLGVRFVKVRAEKLLDPESARGAAIHPADLASLLSRHGVDLVATHVEHEKLVPELLDMEVAFAQGALFGMPRPVRPAAPDAGAALAGAVAPAQASRLVARNVAAR